MRRQTVVAALFALLGAAAIVTSCGGSSSPSQSPTAPSNTSSATTAFEGTVVGTGSQSGALSVTIQSAVATSAVFSTRVAASGAGPLAVAQATGSLAILGGSTISLTGSFDSSTNSLSLSGGGFTLTGTISGAVFSGTYTAPGGGLGGFSSLNATQSTVTAYCGTYHGTPDSGVFDVEISSSGTLSGEAIPQSGGGQTVGLTATVTGSTFSGISSEGTLWPFSGSVQNGGVSGVFTTQLGPGTGTFSGAQCGQS